MKLTLNFEGNSPMSLQGTLQTASLRQAGKITTGDRKKEAKKEHRVHRDELLKEIDKMKTKEREFYQNMDQITKKLPLEDKLFMNKEKKCLENYDKMVNGWNHTVEKINSKLGRVSSESVISKAENFRKKIETAEAFDIVQTDEEKYGSAFWYMTLRKGDNPKEWRQGSIQDIPEGFSASIVDRPKSSVVIIRKPNSLALGRTTSNTNLRESMLRRLDRTNFEYLDYKIQTNSKKLDKIRTPTFDEVGNIMVFGIIVIVKM